MERYGYRSVVVASDSQRKLREFSRNIARRAERPGSPFGSVPVLSTGAATNGDTMAKAGTVFDFVELDTPWKLFLDFAVDLHLMARCDGLVGKFTSNVDRLVYALQTARRGCLVPYVSVDQSPWCMFGRGHSALGSFRC